MCDIGQRLLLWVLAVSILVSPGLAHAWVETQVTSDVATVDISEDGRALVRHELLLRVRGGPLFSYEIDGVDSDAEPIADAIIEKRDAAGARSAPRTLLLHRGDDGSLLLEVEGETGIRHGTYAVRFGYRTDLKGRGYLQPSGSLVTLRWVSPRFSNGVDSMKVIMRMPSGDVRPRLPGAASEGTPVSLDEASGGVFMASVRRSAEKDEVELVRPHVASGEPVVWRVQTSGRAFGVKPDEVAQRRDRVFTARAESTTARRNALSLLLAAGLAVSLAMLVWLKARVLERQARSLGGAIRGVLPGPVGWRAVAAGTLLAAGVLTLWRTVHLVAAVGFVVLAMLLAAHRTTSVGPTPRGPGRWLPLHADEAFSGVRLPGRCLLGATIPGALTFGLAVAGLFVAQRVCLGGGTEAMLTAICAAATLVPVFFTRSSAWGSAWVLGDAPRWLGWLSRRLGATETIRVSPWARVPDAEEAPDELRLRVMPRFPLPGLVSMEVALQAPAGLVEPCVLVRVREGSDAHRVLSSRVSWVRGRRPGEKVAVVHPKLPTRAMALALTQRLVAELSSPVRARAA